MIKKFILLKKSYRIFGALYFAVVAYLVFFARRRRGIHTRSVNLVPFKSLLKDFKNIPHAGAFKYYTDLFGNILLFVPLPFILLLATKVCKPLHIVAIGFLLSFQIELMQFIFVVGYTDVDDVILNTLGTVLGLYLYRKISDGGWRMSDG